MKINHNLLVRFLKVYNNIYNAYKMLISYIFLQISFDHLFRFIQEDGFFYFVFYGRGNTSRFPPPQENKDSRDIIYSLFLNFNIDIEYVALLVVLQYTKRNILKQQNFVLPSSQSIRIKTVFERFAFEYICTFFEHYTNTCGVFGI